MNYKIYIFALLTITLSSCRAIQIADLQPEIDNTELLPNLEPQIDFYSFQSAYSFSTSSYQIISTGLPGEANNGIISVHSFGGSGGVYGNRRTEDVVTLYKRDVEGNICDISGEKAGYIVCKIPVEVSQNKGRFLYVFPHCATLGLSSLLGIPTFFYQTELELEIEILNLDRERIARYTAYGKGRVPSALYWGYRIPTLYKTNKESGVRKANIDAFKMAMKEVKEKINTDYDMLFEKLNP